MDSVSDLKNSVKQQSERSSPSSKAKESDPSEAAPPRDHAVAWQSAKSLGLISPKGFPELPRDWTSEWQTFPSFDGKIQLFSLLHHRQNWGQSQGQNAAVTSPSSVASDSSGSFVPRVLVVFHGIGEHGGRYLHFPHYLEKTFDAVCTLDHRGHGRSEGERGYVESFESLAHDAAYTIRRLEDHLNSRFGKSELHVFGHSLGGLITLQMLLRHPNLPIHSVSVSAPALGLAAPVPRHKWIAGQVARILYPKLQLDSELDVTAISRDPEVVGAYQSDRLVHSKVTPGLFFGMLDAMREVLASQSGFEVPLQFLIPESDRLTDSRVSLAFFERLKLRHKRLRTYPDFFHEICNEPGKERVFDDIERWALLSNRGSG